MVKRPTFISKYDDKKIASIITYALKEDAKMTISDEQIERVAAPIREMILSGYFAEINIKKTPKKPKRYRIAVFSAMVAVVALALTAFPRIFAVEQESGDAYLEIPGLEIPLMGLIFDEDILNSAITLINEESFEVMLMPQGMHDAVPDGVWTVYKEIDGIDIEVGMLIVKNGIAEFDDAKR
ncbi:MAG: hypothetical protein FWC13_06830 [Oscillospiraceae bacterium]|nr:hypothetical protein [Oscillospiraceae bacterium]